MGSWNSGCGVMSARKITKTDLQILFKLYNIEHTEMMISSERWWAQFAASDYAEFKSKYPPGSEGYGHFESVCQFCELAGVMVKHNLINQDLFFDVFILGLYWEKVKSIVYGMRAEFNEPYLFENFEFLYEIEQKWKKKHPPRKRLESLTSC